MKNILLFVPFFFLSCTSFSEYADHTRVENCIGEPYLSVTNDALNLRYKSFGGFKFAINQEDYRKLRVGKNPRFKNVIAYGRSNYIDGSYYILLENKRFPKNFFYKDTLINSRKITIALDKSINNNTDKNFLLNWSQNKKTDNTEFSD